MATDPTPKLTNPARRLFRILETGKEQKSNVQAALAAIFKVDPNDLPILFSKLGGLLTLIEDVSIRIQALETPRREIYMRCVSPIRTAFRSNNLSMQGAWAQHMNGISTSDLGLLQLAAEALDAMQIEVEIPQSDLDTVVQEAGALFDRVRSSQQLEPELRIILLDLLESIRRTVADYQIRGAEGLKKVLSECIGRLALDKEIVLRSQDKDEMKKFWEIVRNVSALFSAANQAPQLGERIGNLIELTLK